MGRTLPFVPVVTSLVAFIAEVTNSASWWVYALDRASYVLVVLAVVAALLSERRVNVIALGAQLAAAATSLVFMAFALVKFYGATPAIDAVQYSVARPWTNEAQVLAIAALAFGLTLARRRSTPAVAFLAAAIAVAFGGAIYAITRKENVYPAETWWSIAIAGAFLAAAFAASLERDGGVSAMDAPAADIEDEEEEEAPPDA